MAKIPKLIGQVAKIRLMAEGMRVEWWVASPEPTVGVFTPAGTCPGRLRRHCVIGCADPGQNPSAVRSGSSWVRGRGMGRARARPVPRVQARSGNDQGAAARRVFGCDRRRRVARQGHAARQSLGPGNGAVHLGMAATEGWEGCGNCRSIACSVNRFVNRTRRDSSRRGRRSRRSEMGSVLSAEVTTPARDGPRRQRRTSYGS